MLQNDVNVELEKNTSNVEFHDERRRNIVQDTQKYRKERDEGRKLLIGKREKDHRKQLVGGTFTYLKQFVVDRDLAHMSPDDLRIHITEVLQLEVQEDSDGEEGVEELDAGPGKYRFERGRESAVKKESKNPSTARMR